MNSIEKYLDVGKLATVIHGECLEEMKKMADCSIDFIVSDPPYGISFKEIEWDKNVPEVDLWTEALRICKPGSMMAVFGGIKKHHRLMCNLEDAGWQIRDIMMWLYGEGFPKCAVNYGLSGYASALKPAWEPIILCMKPFKGTYKENIEKYNIGGFNIEKSRIERKEGDVNIFKAMDKTRHENCCFAMTKRKQRIFDKGRWPSNVILDEESKEILDGQKLKNDVSRFFYCAKVSNNNKEKILFHPTRKPLDLMKYLINLLAPPNDPICLDPFCGSGTTLVAAQELGIRSIGIEMNEEYVNITQNRINQG